MGIRARGGTETAWSASTRILAAREIAVATDTGRIKVGNGTDLWPDLNYADQAAYDLADDAAAFATTAEGHATAAEGHVAAASGHAIAAEGYVGEAQGFAADAEAAALAAAATQGALIRETIATAATAGQTDTIRYDDNYIYIAVGVNEWKRVAISTWA